MTRECSVSQPASPRRYLQCHVCHVVCQEYSLSSDIGVRNNQVPANARRGILCIMLYGFGLPLSFSYILYRYRNEIRADQLLRACNEGETALT
jgi:hypothetical protein